MRFDELPLGAARYRVRVSPDGSAVCELVAANGAFAALNVDLASSLAAAYGGEGQWAPFGVRIGALRLVVTPYAVAADEAMALVEDVSAWATLAERSRVSQARFEKAFHGNAAAMVIASRTDLRIIDVNPRWLELFSATRDEVIGRTTTELGLISETGARTRIAQHRQFADGYDIELELFTRRGKAITVLASAKPIDIEEGPATLTTLIDITGRKYAEEAFAVAFSASPAGMMLVNHETDIVMAVNNRLLEMTGFARDELVGHDVKELDLVQRPSRLDLLAEVNRTGRLNAVEVELTNKRGPALWTLASSETVVLLEKTHRLSVFTDITARKRFEQRLVTQNEIGRLLAESSDVDAALPSVLEALARDEPWMCGTVWLPDEESDSRALQCRAVWHRLDGLAATNVDSDVDIDKTVIVASAPLVPVVQRTGAPTIAQPAHAEGAAGAAAALLGLGHAGAFPILRGTTTLGVVTLAQRGPKETHVGDTHRVEQRGLFEAVGRLLALSLEREHAERSLRQLNAELERRVAERTQALETSNRDLEAFSSSVSHDLRAPLRAINGFSTILLEDFAAQLPAEARELLTTIHDSGTRLRELIDELLQHARLGRSQPRRHEVDLDAMVRSVVDELLAGRQLGGRLDLRLHALGRCSADPTLLRAVWTNLVDNALKYSRDRERIVVEIGRQERGGDVVYYVRDNGVGFDMANADRLFGMFQRLHTAAEFEGTGVGLANVRRIVERHAGRIAATSELGRGSTFEFTLGGQPLTP